MDGWTKGRTDARTDGWTDGQRDRHTYGRMQGRTGGIDGITE